MSAKVKISMWEGDDSERAHIRIGNFGCVSELRFDNSDLRCVANFTSLDVMRLLEAVQEAERKRIDPDSKLIESLEHVMDRIDYANEDKSRLYLIIEAEIPVAVCGSVLLQPNLDHGIPGEPKEES